jgi:hypothetical protein
VQLDGLPRRGDGDELHLHHRPHRRRLDAILIFFAQGFEHSVVNMFVIPAGMLMGAKVSIADWWLWNEIPVTLGNLVGGLLFTGLALYATYGRDTVVVPDALPASAD